MFYINIIFIVYILKNVYVLEKYFIYGMESKVRFVIWDIFDDNM